MCQHRCTWCSVGRGKLQYNSSSVPCLNILWCSSFSQLLSVTYWIITPRAERANRWFWNAKDVCQKLERSTAREKFNRLYSNKHLCSQEWLKRWTAVMKSSPWLANSLLTCFLLLRRALTWLKTTWPSKGWEKHQRKQSVSFLHLCR